MRTKSIVNLQMLHILSTSTMLTVLWATCTCICYTRIATTSCPRDNLQVMLAFMDLVCPCLALHVLCLDVIVYHWLAVYVIGGVYLCLAVCVYAWQSMSARLCVPMIGCVCVCLAVCVWLCASMLGRVSLCLAVCVSMLGCLCLFLAVCVYAWQSMSARLCVPMLGRVCLCLAVNVAIHDLASALTHRREGRTVHSHT